MANRLRFTHAAANNDVTTMRTMLRDNGIDVNNCTGYVHSFCIISLRFY